MSATKFVVCRPRPQAYEVEVDIVYTDVEKVIDKLWVDDPNIKIRGPRPQSRQEWEEKYFLELYREFVLQQLISSVEKQQEKRVCHFDAVRAYVNEGVVHLRGVVWFEPQMIWHAGVLEKVLPTFLGDAVPDEMVENYISTARGQLRFKKQSIQIVSDNVPLQKGDIFQAIVYYKGSAGQMMAPAKKIIVLSEKCPIPVYTNSIGHVVGDEFSYDAPDDKNGPDVAWTIKVLNKVIAPEISDEALCLASGVPGMDALRMNVRRQLEIASKENVFARFLSMVVQGTDRGLVPAEMLHDRAEGQYSWMLSKKKEPQVLQELGAANRNAAMHQLMVNEEREYIASLAAREVLRLENQLPDEDTLDLHAQENSTGLTWETKYVMELDYCLQHLMSYIRNEGKYWGKSRLISI